MADVYCLCKEGKCKTGAIPGLFGNKTSTDGECGPYTTSDMAGPFYEVWGVCLFSKCEEKLLLLVFKMWTIILFCFFKMWIVMIKKYCPGKFTKKICAGSRQSAAWSWASSYTEREGWFWHSLEGRGKSHQVLGEDCQGIRGALVETWYAGPNPHPDRCHCNRPLNTPDPPGPHPQADHCYTSRQDPPRKSLNITQDGSTNGTDPNIMCYNPEGWYRGKTLTDEEGRCFKKALSCCCGTHWGADLTTAFFSSSFSFSW